MATERLTFSEFVHDCPKPSKCRPLGYSTTAVIVTDDGESEQVYGLTPETLGTLSKISGLAKLSRVGDQVWRFSSTKRNRPQWKDKTVTRICAWYRANV